MIIRELFMTRSDGVKLYRTFSDENLKIAKSGTSEVYDEAVDVESADYSYFETDVSIPQSVL